MSEPTPSRRRTGWRAKLQDVGDRLLDRYLGIKTFGIVTNDELGFTTDVGNEYQTSNWLNLLIVRDLFRRLDVSGRDVFIDVGCGRGQVLALAVRYPFARVIGLDIAAPLLEVAARNMDRLKDSRRCGAVELVLDDAAKWPIPVDLTTVYLYMPLPTDVYEVLVHRLAASVAEHPRPMRIIYLNEDPADREVPPRHGFQEVERVRRVSVYVLNDEPWWLAERPASRQDRVIGAVRRRLGALRRALSGGAGTLVKRAFDIVMSAFALVVLSPLILAIAIAVRMRLGSPILFRQQRPGLGGRPFTMLKFRTMTDARGPDGELLEDGERTPALGRKLRALSLDELPELLNVLRGDMSIVGPRPLLMRYLDRYTPEQMRRHEVRPGVTGLAQVSGRNALTWDEKFALDLEYVDRHDLRMDLSIIARTIAVVVRREGIAHPGDDTMPEFMGSVAEPAAEGGDA